MEIEAKRFCVSSIFGWANRTKATIAMSIPKHIRKKYTKEICQLIKTIIEKERLIFHFVGTDKTITLCIEKEIQGMT